MSMKTCPVGEQMPPGVASPKYQLGLAPQWVPAYASCHPCPAPEGGSHGAVWVGGCLSCQEVGVWHCCARLLLAGLDPRLFSCSQQIGDVADPHFPPSMDS